MDSPTLQAYDFDHFWSQENLWLNYKPISEEPFKSIIAEPAFQNYLSNSVSVPSPRPRFDLESLPDSPQDLILTREESINTNQVPETPSKRKYGTSEEYRSGKNLCKNYGKAIAAFALSKLATPYLKSMLNNEGLSMNDFKPFAEKGKKGIISINTFRKFLLIDAKDTQLQAAQKRVFKEIAIVFIKYFSVNWIIHGKMPNKVVYLKHRGKFLRRIMNPQSFTYFKPFKEHKKKYNLN